MRRLRAAWIPAVLALGLLATACGGGGNPLVLTEPVTEICDDQIDNDGDTLIDCNDTDCLGDPACPEICDDLIDNDGDNLIDCNDADCLGDPACPGMLVATFSADPPSPDPRISMDPGSAAGAIFSIQINASGIDDLYGVGFTVLYDPMSATFLGCEAQGSVLVSGGAPSNPCDNSLVSGANFSAALQNGVEGSLNVRASLDGLVPGVPVGTGLLLTLTFQANGVTSSPEPFTFEAGPSREVEACPQDLSPCNTVNAAFDGGTLDASLI